MAEVETTRLSTKGQVVIPRSVRERLHLEPGQLFAVHGDADTIVLKRIATPDPDELKRLLAWGEAFAQAEGITREDVERAIAELRAERS